MNKNKSLARQILRNLILLSFIALSSVLFTIEVSAYAIRPVNGNQKTESTFSVDVISESLENASTAIIRLNISGGKVEAFTTADGFIGINGCTNQQAVTDNSVCIDIAKVNGGIAAGDVLGKIEIKTTNPETISITRASGGAYVLNDGRLFKLTDLSNLATFSVIKPEAAIRPDFNGWNSVIIGVIILVVILVIAFFFHREFNTKELIKTKKKPFVASSLLLLFLLSGLSLSGLDIYQKLTSISELPQTGILPASKVIAVSFDYHSGKEQKITNFKSLIVEDLLTPVHYQKDKFLELIIYSETNSILYRQSISPKIVFRDDMNTLANSSTQLSDEQFDLKIPLIDYSDRIEINDANGLKLYTYDLKPDIAALLLTEETESSQLILKAGSDKIITVGFYGTDFASVADFQTRVAQAKQIILSNEPYKSHNTQLTFITHDKPTLTNCNGNQATPNCLTQDIYWNWATTNGVDCIVVLNNVYNKDNTNFSTTPNPNGASLSFIFASTNASEFRFLVLHEFSHQFGVLDEYVYAVAPMNDPKAINVPFTNCANVKPESTWAGKVGSADYLTGCTAAQWFKTTDKSIMNYISLNVDSKYLNKLSQMVVNNHFNYTVGSNNSKGTPISLSLKTPVPGAAVNSTDSLSFLLNNEDAVMYIDFEVDGSLRHTESRGRTGELLSSLTLALSNFGNFTTLKITAYNGLDVASNQVILTKTNGRYEITGNLVNPPTVVPTTVKPTTVVPSTVRPTTVTPSNISPTAATPTTTTTVPTITVTETTSPTPTPTATPEVTLIPGGVVCGHIDINNDLLVDFRDLAAFAMVYNKRCGDQISNTSGTCGGKDANSDGVVDFKDLSYFAAIYSTGAFQRSCVR